MAATAFIDNAKVMSKGQVTIPKDVREILGVSTGDRVTFIVEGTSVRIAHDKEQRRLPVTDRIQRQLIVHRDVPHLLNVEGSEPCAARNKDRLRRLSRNKMSRVF